MKQVNSTLTVLVNQKQRVHFEVFTHFCRKRTKENDCLFFMFMSVLNLFLEDKLLEKLYTSSHYS